MNFTKAIFLVNDDVRSIRVSYEADPKQPGRPNTRLLKTIDKSVKKGDFVIIPTYTRHGYTVGLVDAVDLDVDHDSGEDMEWAVGKVDVEQHRKIVAAEANVVAQIRESETARRRRELKDNLMKINPELAALTSRDLREGAPVIEATAAPTPPEKPDLG